MGECEKPKEFELAIAFVSACNSTNFVESLQRSIHVKRVTSNNRFTAALPKKQLLTRRRHSGGTEIRHVTKLLDIDKLWDMGYKGIIFELSCFLNEDLDFLSDL
ncbi:unnamed protein product [Onchocerca ochengi]|uniref:3-deoxy-7-phosphoheptulonate synthase n=1 Tax=Onchocerca ochengi TaxID=42157 RepID=A0A182EJW7_ONCOC|nr:unnamed protein product [Onchocerca ochengi]